MSEAHFESMLPDGTYSGHSETRPPAEHGTTQSAQPSFIEQFLNRFFQEKNIKWMLVIGAGIVFGSSLMLVTKAWPSFGPSLKFLTILGYTAVTFAAAEAGRLRLGLTSTWKVLHSLTLLLLPVCFLALARLSPGTAVQNVLANIEILGLMIPATAFLWFASTRILDNLLRGRQTTFLISFQLLCMAGVIPAFVSPVPAFAFMAVCWLLFTAGVIKINRHTFWLAEEKQLPRIFGFLPIAMLGLQFLILVTTKTLDYVNGSVVCALPLQWIGLSCVMVSATVLLTARSVADVFRQRTGDLVRPYPWTIVAPLFGGLVLSAVGVMLAFSGFSYIGPTTFAVIPAAVVAALLMWVTAKDTKHSGFVWAGLIYLTIAYQCAPTLFSSVIQQLKEGVESAIREERLPFAFYGLTYLPLLLFIAAASRFFAKRSERSLSQPMKHFVTLISLALFCAAVTNIKALFLVSLVNVPTFVILAVIFSDRRYVIPAIGALILATGSAITALNKMHVTAISAEYIATAMAALAALLTATPLPDRILNTIPICSGAVLRYRDKETDELTSHSLLLQRSDGSNRGLSQLAGCFLAVIAAAHWMVCALLDFSTALTGAGLLQYAFLMSALVLYTIRHPHYLSGMCVWVLVAFAGVRHAVGLNIESIELVNACSLIAVAVSFVCYVWLRLTRLFNSSMSLSDVRRSLGLNADEILVVEVDRKVSGSWFGRLQAFVVPLCDLCLITLTALIATIHFPLLLKAHAVLFGITSNSAIMLSTIVSALWLAGATVAFKSRLAGVAAAVVTPLCVTAMLAVSAFPLTITWVPVIWSVMAAVSFVCSRTTKAEGPHHGVSDAVRLVSEVWLVGILLGGCLFFAIPLRFAAAISLACFLWTERPKLTPSKRSFFAVMANIHVLLLLAALGQATGTIFTPGGAMVVPLVFAGAAISAILFDRSNAGFDPVIMKTWSVLLRPFVLVLGLISLTDANYPVAGQIAMVIGFAVAAVAESIAAYREQDENRIWSGCAALGLGGIFLFDQGLVHFGRGWSQFVLLGISVAALAVAYLSKRYTSLKIGRRPMNMIGQTLPVLVTVMAVFRELTGMPSAIQAANSLALLLAAGIYFQQGITTRMRRYGILSATIVNIALMLFWQSMDLTQPEFYLVPIGLTVLTFVELLKKELPTSSHDPLRYVGALTILVSPVFHLFGDSWIPAVTLMVLSVVVVLLSIGLRLRALVYTGTAFLVADLIAMVFRSRIDYPLVPWLCGIALGVGVIAFAAFCENHREKVMARIRLLSAELATWG